MPDPVQANQPVCRECGAAYPLTGQKCWLCGADLPERVPLTTGAAAENSFASSAHRTFRLSSLFLVITLAAVCLGVFSAAPGLGIFLAIVSTPALARTVVVSTRRKQAGMQVSAGQKVLTFAGALGVVVVTFLTSSAIALGTACLAAVGGLTLNAKGLPVQFLPIVVGGVVGVGLFTLVLYALWGRRPGKARR